MSINDEIVQYLLGSCKDVTDAMEAFDVSISVVDTAVQEGDIFLCDTCGWWFERFEQSDTAYAQACGDELCEDCGDYDEDEDR